MESKDSALGSYISEGTPNSSVICVSFVPIALPNHVRSCILSLVML